MLALAFAALPISLTSLKLASNALSRKKPDELARIVGAIPVSVTQLDLSNNALRYKSATELTEAFATLHEDIRTITLSVEDIEHRTEEEIIALGQALPYVMEISLVDEKDKPDTHAKLDVLKRHIGGWIAGVSAELSNYLPSGATATIPSLVLEKATGIDATVLGIFALTHQKTEEAITKAVASNQKPTQQNSTSSVLKGTFSVWMQILNHKNCLSIKKMYLIKVE